MKKKLGIWMLTALVIGNMIGSGVFLLPASLAHYGTITIFSWVATAIGATLLALVFSRLSTLFPKTGGPYTYCHKGFGSFIGFQVAYNYWLYIWTGNAAIAIAFEIEVSCEASDQDLAVLERVARACPVAKSLHPDLEQNLSFAFTRV